MFALWYFSLALEEIRKRIPFLDRLFAFFSGNKAAQPIEDVKEGDASGETSSSKADPKGEKATDESSISSPVNPATKPEEKLLPPAPKPVDPPAKVSVVVPPPRPVEPKPEPPKTAPKLPEATAPVIPPKVEPTHAAQGKPASEPVSAPKESPKPTVPSVPSQPAVEATAEPVPSAPTPTPVPDLPSPAPLLDPAAPRLTKEKKQLPSPAPKSNIAAPPAAPEPLLPASNEDSFIMVEKQKPAKPKTDLKNSTANFLQGEGGGAAPAPAPVSPANRNKSDTMVDAAVLEKLEAGFAKLAASDSKSLLKKYLTKEVFDALKNKKTSFGSSLLDCVQSGFENHDSGVGIYAPDAESYSLFSDLFDPIIEDYHKGFKKTDKHPQRDFGDVNAFGNVDPTGEYVVSTRVRCGRSMEGYPFNPCLTEAQYKEMEQKVSSTLSGLDGELKGKFYPLTGMDKAVQQQLIDDHFLFKEGDRFLQAANACRYWPSGRGIYHNDNKTFLVWCNEEDHLRIISMQMGGDLGQVYRRLVTAVNEIEKRVPFSHHDRLGFLTFCPTNLGTTIRASVHIKVPKLAKDYAKLEATADKYNLQVRGTRGEHSEAEGGIYDISNKRRMGLTEFQAVKEMYDGISEIIKIEASL
ncbi:arginine kinase isoform X1 [Anopheles darlingi]|nr:arginine kinase isoform X1 [Anopheles darlingi]